MIHSRRLAGLAFALMATASVPALAVTDADLLKDEQTTGDVLTSNALRRFHVTSRHDSGTALETVRDGAGVDDLRTVRRYLRPDQAPTEPEATTDPTDADE